MIISTVCWAHDGIGQQAIYRATLSAATGPWPGPDAVAAAFKQLILLKKPEI